MCPIAPVMARISRAAKPMGEVMESQGRGWCRALGRVMGGRLVDARCGGHEVLGRCIFPS